MSAHRCRCCGAALEHTFVDLGMSPLCESYVPAERLDAMEPFYPLHIYVCGACFLVQLAEFVSPEHIFSDYAYFSSYSDSWLAHARRYTEAVLERFRFEGEPFVVEVASNDGYLLRHFVERGVRVLGIEPAANVAAAAEAVGVPTLVRFFGREAARSLVAEGGGADLLIGNNVLAQVPDLNDFMAGLGILLRPGGVLTLEFPHLMRLMEGNQFDTIYHEHFSYFSFYSAERILGAHGLAVFDVEELATHGGSLRLYAQHAEGGPHAVEARVKAMRRQEAVARVGDLASYRSFARQVEGTKRDLLTFLIAAKREGKAIAGYGAPGKGNTLLNYCGIRTDFLDYTVDRSPHKQGKYLPGTHIPIHPPERIAQTRPDYVLILPWNLQEEITAQMGHIRAWGGRFVVPIPHVQVL